MATVKRLPAPHYSVHYISSPPGTIGFILMAETIRGLLIRPNTPKLNSLAQKTCKLYTSNTLVYSLVLKDNIFSKTVFPNDVSIL